MGAIYPRWLAGWLVVVGFTNALLVGVPLAYGVISQPLVLLFTRLRQLTLVWALGIGIWMLRRCR